MKTQKYTLNLGPQHPSTHGVLRVVLELDGEICTEATTVIGYLHRGMEKLAEKRTYAQFIPYTDRLDYLAGLTNELGYVQAIEKLVGIEVPERAEYIRVITAELMRMASHLLGVGVFIMDVGAVTGVFYPMIEREKILDLFSMICGARLTFNYIRIGGVAQDLPEEFFPAVNKFIDEFPKALEQYERLVNDNEIFKLRTKNVGVITAEEAMSYGLSGPCLRGSGVNHDVRKVNPYSIYDRFDFNIPVGINGDCYDRYIVRMEEVKESFKIIKQALKQMPEGPTMAKVPKILKPPVGDVYHQIENAKGVYGTYLVSDGTVNPYRTHFRRPSYNNLSIFDKLFVGHKIADIVAIIASFDFDLGEVDA
ncbi:NADH dehydrogenase subunit D [Desulfonispora thiosulfatigenes DSM 11270]|uniref:NADH-quinone oxidoreductase subunit D n=1 Tax=Desulfonispora thiosulfatigenes DSM 11270 TaxID=656914 RepID=A0A1W1VKJ7_DESTI|nr:NADH-quinone oxidoreductase subunit D [Desulfonispora thiosulfatigenes]SMB93899.1 NADH dehydrogenase subunit D [Desulfonispora thiosulfatigenes DSM 11270]